MLAPAPARVVCAAAPRILARAYALHSALPDLQHPMGSVNRNEAHHHVRLPLHAHPPALRPHKWLRVKHVHDVRAVRCAQPAPERAHGGRGRCGDGCDFLLGPRIDIGQRGEFRRQGDGVQLQSVPELRSSRDAILGLGRLVDT